MLWPNYKILEKKAIFPLIFHVNLRVLSFLIYTMCCNEKIRQFRSAGKHAHTPGETTLLHTGTETSVDCFTDIGMSLPASALQEISNSSYAAFSSHTTPKAVFCLKWAPHACSGGDHIPWKRDTVGPESACSSFSFTLLVDEIKAF